MFKLDGPDKMPVSQSVRFSKDKTQIRRDELFFNPVGDWHKEYLKGLAEEKVANPKGREDRYFALKTKFADATRRFADTLLTIFQCFFFAIVALYS